MRLKMVLLVCLSIESVLCFPGPKITRKFGILKDASKPTTTDAEDTTDAAALINENSAEDMTPAFSTSPVSILSTDSKRETMSENDKDEVNDISALEINTKTGTEAIIDKDTTTEVAADETTTNWEVEQTTEEDDTTIPPDSLAVEASNIVNRIGLLGNTLGQNIIQSGSTFGQSFFQSIVQKQPSPPVVEKVSAPVVERVDPVITNVGGIASMLFFMSAPFLFPMAMSAGRRIGNDPVLQRRREETAERLFTPINRMMERMGENIEQNQKTFRANVRNTGALMRSATAAVPKMIVNTTRRAMDGLRKQSQSTLRRMGKATSNLGKATSSLMNRISTNYSRARARSANNLRRFGFGLTRAVASARGFVED